MKKEHSRREFLSKSTMAGLAALAVPVASCTVAPEAMTVLIAEYEWDIQFG